MEESEAVAPSGPGPEKAEEDSPPVPAKLAKADPEHTRSGHSKTENSAKEAETRTEEVVAEDEVRHPVAEGESENAFGSSVSSSARSKECSEEAQEQPWFDEVVLAVSHSLTHTLLLYMICL